MPGPLGPGTAAANRVVEIATGMNFYDPVSQQWRPSQPVFEPNANGDAFVADRVQHRVALSADLNVMSAVTVITPDGQTVSSTPVGIALYDRAAGASLFVGRLTNCPGVLVSSNQVLYQNAFDGVCASILYTIEKGSFARNVILTGGLDPDACGFPADTTELQNLDRTLPGPDPGYPAPAGLRRTRPGHAPADGRPGCNR